MKNFGTVFRFELFSMLRKKAFLVTTLIFVVLLIGATFLPRIIGYFSANAEPEGPTLEGIVLETSVFDKSDFPEPAYRIFPDAAALESAVSSGEIGSGFVIRSLNEYTMYFKDVPVEEPPFVKAFAFLRENMILRDLGVDPAAYRAAADLPILSDMVVSGSDTIGNMPITYLFIFIFYFLVLFYGNTISTSVAREKSDRTMELLITSTDTHSLLFGKVLGAGVAGILQFLLLIGAGMLGYFINKDSFGVDISRFLNIGAKELIYFIAFTLVGYFLYLFLFAAFGSSVSKVEDAQTSTTPITLLLVITYMIAVFSMSMPGSVVFRIASYVPFSSPMIMPARANLVSLSDSYVLLSLAILLVSSLLLGALAAKIYRLGTLNYGNKLSLRSILSSFSRD